KLSVLVPVKLIGQAIGVVDGGGVLQFLTREIAVECLPKDLPEFLEVEISDLEIGQSFPVSGIELPEGITCADELAKIIVSVVTVAAPVLEDEEDEESEEETSEEETSEEAKKE
ncbi:50S ribosomal protein L25, partial [bacterium]|nr:50S ribosomal protein L25 [bacterium]